MTPDLLFLFAPSGQGGGGMTIFFVQMLAIVAIFYFLIIRPKVQQEKRHKERLSQIKKGDEVLTVGGIIGKVVHMKEEQLTVESGGSRLVIHRDRIADILSDKTEAK
ncbi:MAG: preprotein translocase subunit YajC [Gemmatimonadota bacterium]|nr:preprotein translocase subunit YajC [Gemmatimonadota bacterium]